jgi:[ribosomal protein S18]-alanine N-acetyltransferase
MNPESDIRIVPFTTEHLTPVLRIEKTVFRDAWTASAFLEILSFSDKCWVVWAGDEIAAYLVTQWVLDEVHILNVAVNPEWQRKGIARRLLAFLLDLCRTQGMRDLYLEVRVSNSPAIFLYESFGFRELTIRRRYYPDGEDARVMHLHLRDDAAAEPEQENDNFRNERQG